MSLPPDRGIPWALRLLDLLLVALLAVPCLVLGLLVAVAVFLDSPGSVLFRSRRIGRGGRAFAMLKFRTMVRDASGPTLSCEDDARYTPFGRTLARSRLDELPQLWNVIKGEMRLIGPRPEVEDFVREFPDEYQRILSVPPGLTGPSQIHYAWEGEVLARAEERERERVYRESILPYKVAIDLEYASRHSVAGDLRILGRTLLLPARRWVLTLKSHLPASRHPLVPRTAPLLALVVTAVMLTVLLAIEATSPV